MISLIAASTVQFDQTNVEMVEYQYVLYQNIFEACSGIYY
jgi:hypothetical protein